MATSIIDLNDPERRKVTTHASYQIERMLEVILIAACDDDTEPLPYLLRGIVPRLLELNSVVMSSSGDSGE